MASPDEEIRLGNAHKTEHQFGQTDKDSVESDPVDH